MKADSVRKSGEIEGEDGQGQETTCKLLGDSRSFPFFPLDPDVSPLARRATAKLAKRKPSRVVEGNPPPLPAGPSTQEIDQSAEPSRPGDDDTDPLPPAGEDATGEMEDVVQGNGLENGKTGQQGGEPDGGDVPMQQADASSPAQDHHLDAVMATASTSTSTPTASTSRPSILKKRNPAGGRGRRSVTFPPEASNSQGTRPVVPPVVPARHFTEEEIAEWRNTQVDIKQAELAGIVDRHDDYVRELFHLDRFVTLIGFDPVAAKADKSDVFLSFQHNYDLFTQANPGAELSGGAHRRATRRATTDRKTILATPEVAPVAVVPKPSNVGRGHAHGKVDLKGKGKAEDVEREVGAAVQTPKGGRRTSTGGTSKGKGKGKGRQSALGAADSHSPLGHVPSASSSKHALSHPHQPNAKRPRFIETPWSSYTTPFQIPLIPLCEGSLDTFLSSYLDLVDEVIPPSTSTSVLAATPLLPAPLTRAIFPPIPSPTVLDDQAEYESDILNRRHLLEASGRKLLNPDRKPFPEFKRSKDHQENLLEHMAHFSKLVHEEKKAHVSMARKVGRMVLGHFDKLVGKEDRNRKEEEKAKKALAKWTVREVGKKPMPGVESKEGLPSLRSEILDMMGFVENHVVPRFPTKDELVDQDDLVRGDTDVEGVLRVPSSTLLLPLLLGSVVGEDLEAGKELLKLHLPIKHNGGWNDDEMWTPLPLVAGEMSEERDGLNRFPKMRGHLSQ